MTPEELSQPSGETLLFPRPAPSFRFEGRRRARLWIWLLAWTVMLLTLLAPALWNGFPIIFADTGGYLARPFDRTLELGRSAFYGTVLAAALPLNFWPVVVLQAALCAWVFLLVLRTHELAGRPLVAAALLVVLCLLTSLPWYVSQLMPDIFASLAVLALHLLLFRGGGLGRGEKAALATLIAVAIASHMAILGLCAALLLLFALARAWLGALRLPPLTLGAPALAVGFGLLLAPASNAVIAGQFAFTPGGTSFVFGRLVQDGIIARYVRERCPDPQIRLCTHAQRLPNTADGWLWDADTPYWKLGGWKEYEDEARRIILDTLRLYPAQHVHTALYAFVQQLALVQTGEGLPPDTNHHAVAQLERLAPAAMPQFRAARQQQGRLDAGPLNRIHVPLALLATVALPFVVFAPRRYVGGAPAALALTVLLALVVNAAIAGVLSNPNPRYQSRIVWLAPFALAVASLARRRLDLEPAFQAAPSAPARNP